MTHFLKPSFFATFGFVRTAVFAGTACGEAQHRDAEDGRAEEYETKHDQTLNVPLAMVNKPVSQGKTLVRQKQRPGRLAGTVVRRKCDIYALLFWDCHPYIPV